MRKIDWDKPLSEKDKVWLRQSGIAGVEDRIRANEEEHGEEPSTVDIPPDPLTRSALDPEAVQGRRPSEAPPSGAPSDVQGIGAPVEVDDDYDEWSKADLEDEINKRNADPDNNDKIEVTGTGARGAVTNADRVAALRAWDRAHPETPEG